MLEKLLAPLKCDLAVDLGTANTLVCAPGEGVLLDEPSVVAVEQGTNRLLPGGCAVGQMARLMSGRTPDSIAVVRPVQGGVVTDVALCEAMLRYFLRKVRPSGWRLRPRVLLTIPAHITPVEKRALVYSAQRAGAGRVYLVTHAVAAAIGAGLPISEPVASMVCDVGSGTTDLAIFSLGKVVAGRSTPLGGDAMDRAIVTHLRRQRQLRVSPLAAERLRLEVGSAIERPDAPESEISGVDLATGLPRRASIAAEEVRAALAEPLAQLVDTIRDTLDATSTDLATDLLDQGLTLTGGAALLPGLESFLANQTGLPTRLARQPQSAVALGAAECLEHLDDWRRLVERCDDED